MDEKHENMSYVYYYKNELNKRPFISFLEILYPLLPNKEKDIDENT